jgi:hypothetical protein
MEDFLKKKLPSMLQKFWNRTVAKILTAYISTLKA